MATSRARASVGEKLRGAREQQGKSLRQISDATKISVLSLQAIERDDVSRLPGGIFNRAFVRSYASEVGLNPEVMVEEFLDQFPSEPPVPSVLEPEQSSVDHSSGVDSRAMTATLWLVAMSLSTLGALLYLGAGERRPDPGTAKTDHARAVPPSRRPVEARRLSAALVNFEVPRISTAGFSLLPEGWRNPTTIEEPGAVLPVGPSAEPLRGEDGFTVELRATAVCWVSATVDGERVVEKELQIGDRQQLDVRHDIVLTAGDAGALAVTINGVHARPLGEPGRVVTVTMTLANFEDLISQ